VALAAGLALLLGFAFFFRLGALGLMDPDEPRYAGAAREMMESGDLWIPRFNGEIRIVKPILPYWFILGAYRVFGVSEFAARLPSAIAGLGTVIVAGWLARRLFGGRAAILGATILATSALQIGISRLSTPDASLGFFVTVVFASFAHLYLGGGRGVGAKLALWIAAAAGFLVKGPVAVLLPGLGVTSFLLWNRDLRFFRRIGAGWGIPLFLVLAVPWYAAVALDPDIGGARVFLAETIGRYFGEEKIHPRPFWYLAAVAAAGYFPWSLYALRGPAASSERGPSWAGRFLVAWLAAGLIFLSLSPNKLPSYVVPLGPAIAILAAAEFDRRIAREWVGTKGRWLVGIEGGVVVAAAISVGRLTGRLDPSILPRAVPLLVLAGLFGVAMATILPGRLTEAGIFAMRAVALPCVFVIGFALFGSRVESERSYKAIARVLAPRIRPDDLLVEGWFHQPGLVFYSHHNVVRLDSVENIRSNFAKAGRMYCLLEERMFHEVATGLRPAPVILHRAWGKVLFSNVRE